MTSTAIATELFIAKRRYQGSTNVVLTPAEAEPLLKALKQEKVKLVPNAYMGVPTDGSAYTFPGEMPKVGFSLDIQDWDITLYGIAQKTPDSAPQTTSPISVKRENALKRAGESAVPTLHGPLPTFESFVAQKSYRVTYTCDNLLESGPTVQIAIEGHAQQSATVSKYSIESAAELKPLLQAVVDAAYPDAADPAEKAKALKELTEDWADNYKNAAKKRERIESIEGCFWGRHSAGVGYHGISTSYGTEY